MSKIDCGIRIAIEIGHERNQHDEHAAGGHLDGLAEPGLASIKREHVFGEHRGQREDLRIARHHRRHHARAEDAPPATAARSLRPGGESHRRRRPAREGGRARPARAPARRTRARPAPRASASIAGTSLAALADDAQEHRRQPDRQHAERIQDHRLPEVPSRLAVRQKMPMCGNAIEESGMNV